jgi:16S rRNA processing protein RimM
MAAEALVVVGVVGKPFGLAGDVYVRPDPDLDDGFPEGRSYRTSGTGAPSTLTVAVSRLHSGRRVVRFDDVNDREGAAALRGVTLAVPRDEVTIDADAFWASDLVGRDVVDDAGDLVGVVEQVVDGPAHDYLVLARPDGGEVSIPAVDALLDIGADRIVVHAIPGLLGPDGTDR